MSIVLAANQNKQHTENSFPNAVRAMTCEKHPCETNDIRKRNSEVASFPAKGNFWGQVLNLRGALLSQR